MRVVEVDRNGCQGAETPGGDGWDQVVVGRRQWNVCVEGHHAL